jgi:hypothetical protein
MSNTWKGRQRPHIKHSTSLFENEVLGAFMAGHLVLEAILVQNKVLWGLHRKPPRI